MNLLKSLVLLLTVLKLLQEVASVSHPREKWSFLTKEFKRLMHTRSLNMKPSKVEKGGLQFNDIIEVFKAPAVFNGTWQVSQDTNAKIFNGFKNRQGSAYMIFQVDDQDTKTTRLIVNFKDQVRYAH